MDIGGTLRRLRLSRNLTQEDLADRCELSKGFISQVENNLTSPSIATLTDLIECLGTSLKQFFSEADRALRRVFAVRSVYRAALGRGAPTETHGRPAAD